MSNVIQTIDSYLDGKTYFFDDREKDIVREAFVGQTEVLIGEACNWSPKARLMFSPNFFPDYNVCAVFREGEANSGTYYEVVEGPQSTLEMKFWLCGCLGVYMNPAPYNIYASIKPLN